MTLQKVIIMLLFVLLLSLEICKMLFFKECLTLELNFIFPLVNDVFGTNSAHVIFIVQCIMFQTPIDYCNLQGNKVYSWKFCTVS